MNIDEKLRLSAREGVVTFIKEGIFYRCYQQSLFAYLMHLPGEVKVLHKQIKCLNGKDVLWGGFPESRLPTLSPKIVMTEWGAEVKQVWSTTDYDLWFSEQCNSINAAALISTHLCANDEYEAFLISWEEGKYPRDVDSGFIRALKNALPRRH